MPRDFHLRTKRLPTIAQTQALCRGVQPLRIDHFNLFTSDMDRTVAVQTRMGLRATEYTENAKTGKTWAACMTLP